MVPEEFIEFALAPYVLPAKFDEERVEHLNLRNERISKLAEILEPHDIKLQVSEQALQQSFHINGLSGFTIQRTVDNCVHEIGRPDATWLYDDKTVFVVMDPSEFDQALQKKYEHKWALRKSVKAPTKISNKSNRNGSREATYETIVTPSISWRASRKNQTRLYFWQDTPEDKYSGT